MGKGKLKSANWKTKKMIIMENLSFLLGIDFEGMKDKGVSDLGRMMKMRMEMTSR